MCALETADARFSEWMRDTHGIGGARLGPRLSGGNVNVTRLVESDAGRFVLRHAPAETVSEKAAAGIAREFRIVEALTGVARVPRAVGYCADASIIGAPFALTAFVDGTAISTALPAPYANDTATIDRIGEELVDALAEVHVADWKVRLPAGFGKPQNFVRRQVERWTAIREADAVRDLPLMRDLSGWLLENLPPEGPAAIVHNDYHLDNTLFDTNAPRLNAIIDWEMGAVGHPMIDLGLVLMFWGRPDRADLGFGFVQKVSNRPGVVSARALAERWSARTGFDSDALDYFRCLAFWRLAAMVEGAYCLYRRGQVDTPYARGLEADVPALLREAAALVDGSRGDR